MKIYSYSRFRQSYRRLDARIRKRAETRVALFRKDPFDVRLDTHRLHGKLKRSWSFSVDRRYRVLFEFLDVGRREVVFLDIGTHAIYK